MVEKRTFSGQYVPTDGRGLEGARSRGGGTSKITGGTLDASAGKSRLVRYPNPSNALRALLDQADPTLHKSVTVTFKHRDGSALRLGDLNLKSKPSPSERSKPSPHALKLIQDAAPEFSKDGRFYRRKRPSTSKTAASAAQLRMEPVPIADAQTLGALVRVRRTVLTLNQQELADRAGVGRRFVSELESGKATLELGKALAVCQVLGIGLTAEVIDGG